MLVMKQIKEKIGLVPNLFSSVNAILLIIECLETRDDSLTLHLHLADHIGVSIFHQELDCAKRLVDSSPFKTWRLNLQEAVFNDLGCGLVSVGGVS